MGQRRSNGKGYGNVLMLIKRRPPQLYVFVENNYRHEHVRITKLHEHVRITKLYVEVHTLYDRQLYECIL